MAPRPRPLDQRLARWLDTSAGPEGCWPWIGVRNNAGYGRLNIGGRLVLSHRLAWQLANGPIPEGMLVLHRCDNPACANPAHLFLGTFGDNSRDMAAKGRHGLHQHPERAARRERNGRALLTLGKVRAIRREHASGATHVALSSKYQISRSQIGRIVRGESWAS